MRLLQLALLCLLAGCFSYDGLPEEVSFRSKDGTLLRGSIVFPSSPRDAYPAVVLLHGAEPATRSFAYRLHANVFLNRGFAVLLYDKRGAGESGGVHRATFHQLIDDALAAVELVAARTDIDPNVIGIVSASESGWFTPEIVHRSGKVSFAINKVGPSVSWQETVAWEYLNDLQRSGRSPEEAQAEVDLVRRIWAYQIEPDAEAVNQLEQEVLSWERHSHTVVPATLTQVSPAERHRLSYDPTPFLRQTAVPMLYVYGSDDINVPTQLCVANLTALQADGASVSFHVFEGAGHELGGPSVRPPFYHFEEGYADLIGDFAAGQN